MNDEQIQRRGEAIERFSEARRHLYEVAPDAMQSDAIRALRETVLTWRDGDDPRKLIGAAIFILEAFDPKALARRP